MAAGGHRENRQDPVFDRRILILIPHPDDEVVGAAAAIGRARAMGVEVFGLFLTTGVPPRELEWRWRRSGHRKRIETRRHEAEEAAQFLGITGLGFSGIPSRRLKDHMGEAGTAIREAMRKIRPDVLWVPAYEGGHQDHDVANGLAAALEGASPVHEFAEYNFADGRVRSQTFPRTRGDETELILTADETAHKRKALALYASERGNLGHVDCRRECFRPLAAYDYRRPPHSGRLFYERFQWVPFRHPRVDFTPPAAVCKALERLHGAGEG